MFLPISVVFRYVNKTGLDTHVSAEPFQTLVKHKEAIIKSLEIKVCLSADLVSIPDVALGSR